MNERPAPFLRGQSSLASVSLLPSFLLRGEVMLKMGERIKALDNFRAAIELSPGNITIASKIGEAYLGMGQPERAKEYFDEVLEDTDLPSDHAAKRRARVLREIAVKFVGSAA